MFEEEKKDLIALKDLLLHVNNTKDMFYKYSKIYPHSNEILSTILNGVEGDNKKALTVLSSGDQLYDLILKGYRNIDTFDINKFTKYYALGLKKYAIKNLDLNEYCKNFGVNDNINNDIIKYLIDFMDESNRYFWTEYVRFISNNVVFDKLFFENCTKNIYFSDINYLRTEDYYNIVKSNIDNCNINYYNSNINDLINLKNKYDLIYLSNICEYIDSNINKEIIQKIYKHLLKDHGSIYVVGSFNVNKNLDNKLLKIFTDDFWGFTRIIKENNFDIKEVLKRERKLYRR